MIAQVYSRGYGCREQRLRPIAVAAPPAPPRLEKEESAPKASAPAAPPSPVELLRQLFLNREDVLYVSHPTLRRAAGGEARKPGDAKEKPKSVPRILAVTPEDTDALLRSHLDGTAAGVVVNRDNKPGDWNPRRSGWLVGVTALSGVSAGSLSKWICLDFDGAGHKAPLANAYVTALETYEEARRLGLTCYLERSKGGSGFHLWLFLPAPIKAAEARALGLFLAPKDAPLAKGGVADPQKNLGIEVFPKQSRAPTGNMVWLPFWCGATAPNSRCFDPESGQNVPLWRLETCDSKALEEVLDEVRGAHLVVEEEQPKRERTYRPVVSVDLDDKELSAIVAGVAPALSPLDPRGPAFRHLAGAMLRRGLDPKKLPEVFDALALAVGEDEGKRRERRELARSKVHYFQNGAPISGYGLLRQEAPDVARALDKVLPEPRGAKAARAEANARGREPGCSREEARSRIAAHLAAAPRGLSVVRSTEGIGKSTAAREVAELRAKEGKKTLIIAPDHTVAERSYVAALQAGGFPVLHRRSVLAVRDLAGEPGCTYHAPLERLAAGGHRTVTSACLGLGLSVGGDDASCPHRSTCSAFAEQRQEPPSDCLIVVSVSEYLPPLLEWAGQGGLVILDEDQGGVEAHTLSAEDIEHALLHRESYQAVEGFRLPVLQAFLAGLRSLTAPEKSPAKDPLHALFLRGVAALSGDAAWVQLADVHYKSADPEVIYREYAIRVAYHQPKGKKVWRRRADWAPWLSRRIADRWRFGTLAAEEAARLERSSRVQSVLAQAVVALCREAPEGAELHEERALASLDSEEGAGPVLRIVRWSQGVAAALAREGPTVLLDATAQPLLVNALAGREVPILDIKVRDGAPVERVLLYRSNATRKRLLSSGKPVWSEVAPLLVAGAREALERLQRLRPGVAWRVGLISWRALLDGILGDWRIVPLVAPLLEAGGVFVLPENGYFGNVRGRNDWLGVDALIDLGDPRPNLPSVRAVAAALGLSAEVDAVMAGLTAGELSQAHGRPRWIWSETGGAAIHIGAFLPTGWDARTEVKELPPGDRVGPDPEEVAEAVESEGSLRGAATALGLSWGKDFREMVNKAVAVTDVGGDLSEVSGSVVPLNPGDSRAVTGVGGEKLSKIYIWDSRTPPTPVTARESLDSDGGMRPGAASTDEIRGLCEALGGLRQAATVTGLQAMSLSRYASGRRTAPPDVVGRLRAALARTRGALSPEEQEYLQTRVDYWVWAEHSDEEAARLAWQDLLAQRELWAAEGS